MVSLRLMLRFAAVPLAMAAVAVLASCSERQVLVVADPYWTAAWLSASGAEKALSSYAAQSGATLTVKNVSYAANDPSGITAAIAQSKAELVILSPLLSPMAGAVARAFPEKRIVRFGMTPQPEPSNIVTLTPEPDTAFREAGAAAANYAAKAARGAQRGGTVVALFSNDAVGNVEARSFEAGYANVEASPPLEMLSSRYLERAALRTKLLDSSSGHTVLYVFAAGGLDSFALDLLNGSKTPIITENWINGAAYGGRVIYSLDEDVLAALRKTVETMGRPADNQIGIPWNMRAVESPVKD